MTKRQILRLAREAFDQDRYADAVQLLDPLREKYLLDWEVYSLLLDCYMQLEDWDAAEQLIQQHGKACGEVQYGALLQLYLARKDVQNALKISAILISESPDFYEDIAAWGLDFKSAGFETEYLNQLATLTAAGYDPNLAIANYYALQQDYQSAIACVRLILNTRPNDELLQSYLSSYQEGLMRQFKDQAQKQLSGATDGDGIAITRAILEYEPNNVTAQEYYLAAQACKKFPPFYWYFHQNNFISNSPMIFRAIALMIFCLACALYYKGGKPTGTTDHLKSVIWLFTAIAIPRYSLYPLSVQLWSFWYVPGYHLLKKPYDFLKGLILLSSWTFLLYLSVTPSVRSFEYFLCGCFAATYIGLLEMAGSNQNLWQKRLLLAYTLVSGVLGVLGYWNIVSDGFLFFLFGGWVPPLFAAMAIDFYKKNINTGSGESHDPNLNRHVLITRNIHVGSLVAAILLTVLFFASQKMAGEGSNWIGLLSFAIMLYAVTLFSFTEVSPSIHSFSRVWGKNTSFRWLFSLCSVGMVGGLMTVAPYAHIPMRSSWHWIPGVAVFLVSWTGLFVLYYKYLKHS